MRAGRGPLKFPSGWQRTHLPGDSQLLWLPSQGSLLVGETDVYLKDKGNWGHTQDPEKLIPGYIVLLRAPPVPLNPFIISLTSPVCLLSLFLSEEAKKRLTLFQRLLFTLPGNTSAAFSPFCLLLCYFSRFNDWHTRGEKDGSPFCRNVDSWAPHIPLPCILASVPTIGPLVFDFYQEMT